MLKFVLLMTISIINCSSASALVNDTRNHYPSSYSVPLGKMAMDWDYRLYWLEDQKGQKWGLMVNTLRTASHILIPSFPFWLPYFNDNDQLQVLLFNVTTGEHWYDEWNGKVDSSLLYRDSRSRISRAGLNNSVNINGSKFSIKIDAVGTKPKAFFEDYPHGVKGVINNGMAGKAPYVSQTGVVAHGEVCLKKGCFKVSGRQWLDRQWMLNDILKNLSLKPAWQWFAVLLEGDRELMLYTMWDSGSGRHIKTFGALMDGDKLRPLNPKQITITPTKTKSEMGMRYATSWNLSLVMPNSSKFDFTLKYLVKSPWYHSKSSFIKQSYLEGPCGNSSSKAVLKAWCEQVDFNWFKPGI
ncbi:MAG: hypothetical protein HOE90_03905 [Bacteriovoracaceae bacterium]|jgi:predicted secreted hydrolase|nr:hypothetical protein [Bacteriovoracaceae bacterium]